MSSPCVFPSLSQAEVAALRSELQAAVAQMQQEREGQVAAPAPAAQEQRTREELKVRWCGLGGGAVCI